MIEEILRQTGRTTRNVKEVNDLSLKGRVFFVVPEPMKYHYKRLFGHNANVIVIGDLSKTIYWICYHYMALMIQFYLITLFFIEDTVV